MANSALILKTLTDKGMVTFVADVKIKFSVGEDLNIGKANVALLGMGGKTTITFWEEEVMATLLVKDISFTNNLDNEEIVEIQAFGKHGTVWVTITKIWKVRK